MPENWKIELQVNCTTVQKNLILKSACYPLIFFGKKKGKLNFKAKLRHVDIDTSLVKVEKAFCYHYFKYIKYSLFVKQVISINTIFKSKRNSYFRKMTTYVDFFYDVEI